MDELVGRAYRNPSAGMEASDCEPRRKIIPFERRLELNALASRLAGEIAKKAEPHEQHLVFRMMSDLLPC